MSKLPDHFEYEFKDYSSFPSNSKILKCVAKIQNNGQYCCTVDYVDTNTNITGSFKVPIDVDMIANDVKNGIVIIIKDLTNSHTDAYDRAMSIV